LKAVVLTFDRLPTHLLGCYGNEWTETPGFDRLAALGSVFDQHFAEVPGSVGPDHAWWTGRFEYFAEAADEEEGRAESDSNWIQRLGEQGVKCRLLAENTEGLPSALFYSSEAVGGVTGLNARHDDVPIARLVQRGIEILSDVGPEAKSLEFEGDSQPELIWLHSAGVPSPWLPPRLFAELYLDELEEIVDGESGSDIASDLVGQFENDPDLVRLLLSDWRREAEAESDFEGSQRSESDSDEIESPELERQISRLVFAGYVSMIDRWFLKLLQAVEASDEQILLVVSANQGHSFGETVDPVPGALGTSLDFGDADSASNIGQPGSLNDSEVRTPLLIAEFSGPSGGKEFGSRHSGLVQPVDVAATLADWLSRGAADLASSQAGSAGDSLLEALAGDTPEGRSTAFLLGADGRLGVRNRHWGLVTSADALREDESMDAEVQLFAKPDDQWDVHDVASQYREEVDALLGELRSRNVARCPSK
jgi:arylsulfatase A-like enzyme